MFVKRDWARRRWMDFRFGHSTYLVFLMGFSNFILIAYNFVPQIKTALGLVEFTLLFVLLYIPTAILVGHWHIRNQLPTETAVGTERTPYREQILKGKEEMYAQFYIFNAQYQQWATNVHKNNMEALNYLLEHFNAPQDVRYKDEIALADKWISEQKNWQEIFELFKQGYTASDIMQQKLNVKPTND